jgi:O-acetyl-ADP-ribose deacetylase (regulator of RNase III)
MGAGIALQIKRKWPKVDEAYREACEGQTKDHNFLGKVLFCKADDETVVANLFGQFATSGSERMTNYEALYSGLEKVAGWARENNVKVGLPYKMSSALAGGNWNIVFMMVQETLGDLAVVVNYGG